MDPRNSRLLAEILEAEFVELDSGHMVQLGAHEEFNAALLTHMRDALTGNQQRPRRRLSKESSSSTFEGGADERLEPDDDEEGQVDGMMEDFTRVELFVALPRS